MATHTKYLRTHDWDKDANKGKGAFVKRATPLPAEDRENVGDCAFCHKPVYASKGQILNFFFQEDGRRIPSHKICRKGRNIKKNR